MTLDLFKTLGSPDSVTPVEEPRPPHRGPTAVCGFEGKQWGIRGNGSIGSKVVLEGVGGTARTRRVRQGDCVAMWLGLCSGQEERGVCNTGGSSGMRDFAASRDVLFWDELRVYEQFTWWILVKRLLDNVGEGNHPAGSSSRRLWKPPQTRRCQRHW
jgi:hypothetical protein